MVAPGGPSQTDRQRIWTDPLAGLRPGERPRHGRTVMRRSQRDRLLRAVVDVVAEHGYQGLTIRRLVAQAGVSNPTLYAHFKTVDECLLAAYDEVVEYAMPLLTAAYGEGSDPVDGLERGLRALLSFAGEEPAIARACLIEVPAAGSEGYARHVETIERLGRVVGDALAAVAPSPASEVVLHQMIAGGIYQVVQERVGAGQTDQLAELAPELIHGYFDALVPAG